MSTNGIDAGLEREVAALISREAMLLDRRRWQEWLDLYTEDAVYWAPAWASEEEINTDPEIQLNLIYLKNRGRLEDRVFRIESRQSWASLPLDRTVHVIGNVLVERVAGDAVDATANCIVHVYGKKGAATRGSRYDFAFKRIDGALKITRKKIVFIDDRLEGPVDIYHL